MKISTYFSIISTLLLCSNAQIFADSCLTDCLCGSVLDIEADCGWRQDQVDFKILTKQINTLNVIHTSNSVKFQDINSIQTGARVMWTIPCGMYFRLRGDYATVYHAKLETKTVADNAPSFEFSPKFKDGYAYDLLGGIGYQFHLFSNQLILAPIAGWSDNVINLDMHHGTLSGTFPVSDTISAELAEYHYHGRCQGPWIGLDMIFCPTNCINAYGSIEYHWNRLDQENTNELNTIFEAMPGVDLFFHQDSHLSQRSNCGSIEATLGFDYALWDSLSIGLVGHYRYVHGNLRKSTNFQAQTITDSQNAIVTPTTEVETPTQKSKLSWQSGDVELALIYRF